MDANQTQIPVIQTKDANLTQIQQNTNKVFRNINNKLVEVEVSVSTSKIIGEIKIFNLTVAQLQDVSVAGDWLLCNGQSCVDTKYSKLTGNNTVPNIALGSINTFIRVN